MRETERAMKEIHKFLQEQETENMSMDEINALLQAHLKEINANIPKELSEETAKTADDLIELAEQKYEEGDEKGALRLARKAQKMDPDNLDIDLFLIACEEGDIGTIQKKFQRILEKGKTILEKQGCFQEDVGQFWQVLETRPYIRAKGQYVLLLARAGKLKKAAQEAEDIIRLNEQDNLGIRYVLMHLYAALEDAESAQKLLGKYSKYEEGPILLALTLLYYKLDETDQAKKYLRQLTKVNKETRAFVRDVLTEKVDRVLSVIEKQGGFAPLSEEELVEIYNENIMIYLSAPDFFDWLANELKL